MRCSPVSSLKRDEPAIDAFFAPPVASAPSRKHTAS